MTSFQRMVLVAAVLFMITVHVTDALSCNCYPQGNCEGNYEDTVEGVRPFKQTKIFAIQPIKTSNWLVQIFKIPC